MWSAWWCRLLVGVGAIGGALGSAAGTAARAQDVVSGPPLGAGSVVPAATAATGATAAGERRSVSTAAPATTEQQPPPRKTLGAEGADLLDELRRRYAEEERRRADFLREHHERLLYQFAADMRDPSPLGFAGEDVETPAEAFLLGVRPRDLTYARVRHEGVDKYAWHQIRRQYKKIYNRELERRREAEPRRYTLDEYLEDVHEMRFSMRENQRSWNRPFPCYWDGHPSARGGDETMTLGERLAILRLGHLTLDNEMRLRYDLRGMMFEHLPEPDEEHRVEQPRPRHANPRVRPVSRGSLLSAENFELSGRLHASGVNLRGELRKASAELDWTFFDPYDRRELFEVSLEIELDPNDEDHEVSLLLRVASF